MTNPIKENVRITSISTGADLFGYYTTIRYDDGTSETWEHESRDAAERFHKFAAWRERCKRGL